MSKKTLTRADLSKAIQDQTGLSGRESSTLLDEVFAEMTGAMARGDSIKIAGFGGFFVRQKNPRLGRNPRTGEEAVISRRRVVSFRPSAQLRHKVKGK